MDIQSTASLRQIFWHKGLYLQPQHLQHTDLYHQSQLMTMMNMANPFFYGVALLELNEIALTNDVLEVVNGEFIIPGGGFVDFPDSAILAPRSFTAAWKDRNVPFSVYIGMRRMKPRGGNVTLVAGSEKEKEIDTRYLAEAEETEVPDYHLDGPPAGIRQLNHVLKLFWESELEDAADYHLLKIAEIVNDGGTTKLSSIYVPPCIYLASSQNLLRILKEIRDELAGRIRQLEDYKISAGTGGSNIDTRVIRFLLATQTLSQYVPLLFQYIDAATIHPFVVYGVLRQMIGAISTLSTQVNFLGETDQGDALLPRYLHNDLGTCFDKAQKLVLQLLNEITVKSETIVRFENRAPGEFIVDVSDIPLKVKSAYLCVITAEPVENWLASFQDKAKIGSENDVMICIERSLTGLKLTYLKTPPEGVPRRPNATYFRFDKREKLWDSVVQQKTIMVYWDNAPEDAKLDFISL
jgi:type VI secretion system protein ImpJ